MIEALILAGGLGTRLREETEFKPKPMVEVGGRPILWHIMKNLSTQGVSAFTVATGYKGEVIKDYFLNYHARNNDVTVDLGTSAAVIHHGLHDESSWKVTVANTGELTMTGGRVHRAARYISRDYFLCTYGDGLADVNLEELLAFHNSHGKMATVTTVQNGRYGPYVTHGTDTRTLTSEDQLFTVDLDQAIEIYKQPKVRRRGVAKPPLKELGVDTATGRNVIIKDGRFGMYITDGETNATLRRGDTVEFMTLQRGLELLAGRRAWEAENA